MEQTSVKHCQRCGKEFPPGTHASKMYCADCLKARHEEAKQREREKRKQQEKPVTFGEKDRAYCAVCRYHGNYNAGYLCNYLELAGHRRECPAGVKCTKRELGAHGMHNYERRICERCGKEYVGTKRAHYCASCRNAVWREKNKAGWGTWG